MTRVKYICKKCNHAEPFTKKDYLLWNINDILKVFGAFFLFFVVYVGYSFTHPEKMFDFTGAMLGTAASKDNSELRMIAVNETRECGSDDHCRAEKLYLLLRDFDYTLGAYNNMKIYAPEDTLKLKAGDCKNIAYTYASLANQIGLNVKVVCTVETKHCWNKVKFENGEIFLVDATWGNYGYYDEFYRTYYSKS